MTETNTPASDSPAQPPEDTFDLEKELLAIANIAKVLEPLSDEAVSRVMRCVDTLLGFHEGPRSLPPFVVGVIQALLGTMVALSQSGNSVATGWLGSLLPALQGLAGLFPELSTIDLQAAEVAFAARPVAAAGPLTQEDFGVRPRPSSRNEDLCCGWVETDTTGGHACRNTRPEGGRFCAVCQARLEAAVAAVQAGTATADPLP